MVEGPIRRACNRCHTQKLSCKRVGNEACERCVRLKAECKSSASLRFRKPSNGSNSTSSKSSSRQNTSVHRDQNTLKRGGKAMSKVPEHSAGPAPYPGPYSYDGMTEHLWPAHSVDAGLLIYRPDGNQIRQTLPPAQISYYDNSANIMGSEYIASPMANMGSGSSFPISSMEQSYQMAGPLAGPWTGEGHGLNASWGAESCADASLTQLHGAMAANGTSAPYMGSVFASQGMDVKMEELDQSVHHATGFYSSAQSVQNTQSAHGMQGMQKHLGLQRASTTASTTVSKALFSTLCTVSTQLAGLRNALPVAMGLQNERQPLHQSQGQTRSGSFDDRSFPMDSLFALSQRYIEALEGVCLAHSGDKGSRARHDPSSNSVSNMSTVSNSAAGSAAANVDHAMSDCAPNATAGVGSEQVDAGSFVAVAGSTYDDLLDVYQSVLHLVHSTARSATSMTKAATKAATARRHESVTGEVNSSQREATAQACLDVCRFPDVSVGGFSIASTPALQLGLGLRLADNFLAHFSHSMAAVHRCFSAAANAPTSVSGVSRVSGVSTGSSAAIVSLEAQMGMPAMDNVASMLGPFSSTYEPLHPPLVFSEDVYATSGLGMYVPWGTPPTDAMSTPTSISPASTTSSAMTSMLFPPLPMAMGAGSGMATGQAGVDTMAREAQLRQDLAALRSTLSS